MNYAVMILLAVLPMSACVSTSYHQKKLSEVAGRVKVAQDATRQEQLACEGTRRELSQKDARLRVLNQLNDDGSLRYKKSE
jgi:hypothetical protein